MFLDFSSIFFPLGSGSRSKIECKSGFPTLVKSRRIMGQMNKPAACVLFAIFNCNCILCLGSAGAGQPSLTETLLGLMERLLVEAASCLQTVAAYQASTSATARDISSLLEHAVHMRPGTHLHHRLLRVLPFLTYANRYELFGILQFVLDPNTLNLDPDPGFWADWDLVPGFCYNFFLSKKMISWEEFFCPLGL